MRQPVNLLVYIGERHVLLIYPKYKILKRTHIPRTSQNVIHTDIVFVYSCSTEQSDNYNNNSNNMYFSTTCE